jgi:hypothetical protein
MIPVRDTVQGATFAIKVHPHAKKDGVAGQVGDTLKLAVTSPPVEGKANAACIRLLAEVLGVPRSSITIVAGGSGRLKLVRVVGMSAVDLQSRLQGYLY